MKIVKHSKGEKLCGVLLRSLLGRVNVRSQYNIAPYYYDFKFVHNNIHYLVEYDGIQHFQFVQFIHRRENVFKQRWKRDIKKMTTGLLLGYRFIRIDYKVNDIKYHIDEAIKSNKPIYVSNLELYMGMLTDLWKIVNYDGFKFISIN